VLWLHATVSATWFRRSSGNAGRFRKLGMPNTNPPTPPIVICEDNPKAETGSPGMADCPFSNSKSLPY